MERGDRGAGWPTGLTRDSIERALEVAGVGRRFRVTVPALVRLVRSLEGDVDDVDAEAAAALLDRLEERDAGFSAEAYPAILALPEDIRCASDGPYAPLAAILTDFLVDWSRDKPFGPEWSGPVSVVVAQQVIEMHGLRLPLLQDGRQGEMGGAVAVWVSRLGDPRFDQDQTIHGLARAVLGRVRLGATGG